MGVALCGTGQDGTIDLKLYEIQGPGKIAPIPADLRRSLFKYHAQKATRPTVVWLLLKNTGRTKKKKGQRLAYRVETFSSNPAL